MKLLIRTILCIVLVTTILSASAYIALEPTPVFAGTTCGNASLGFVSIVCLPFIVQYDSIGTFLSGAFKLAMGFGAVAAIVMLVIGGFQYMTQDAVGGQKEARSRIQGAIFGLILLLLSYLILFVINPDILKSTEKFEKKLKGASALMQPLVTQHTT